MTTSIGKLRVYQSSCSLEDAVHDLIQVLPANERYRLSNDLRRSSTAVPHHLADFHHRYGFAAKLESLHGARGAAQQLHNFLGSFADQGYGDTAGLQDQCTAIIKQCWGLIRHLKQNRIRQNQASSVSAVDELVAIRT